MEVIAGKTAVDHLYRTDLNDLVSFIVSTDLVHTRGFGIEDNDPVGVMCVCNTHSENLLCSMATL